MPIYTHLIQIDDITVRVKSRSKDKVNPQTLEVAHKYAKLMKLKMIRAGHVPDREAV